MPRSHKLSKSRITDRTCSKSPSSPSPYENDCATRTSYDQLATLEGRQLLKEQLTGAFPETAGTTFLEQPTSRRMATKGVSRRMSSMALGNNLGANTSSSTIDSVGSKKPSNLPETHDKAIDIEQAINLLQELKKTASPDELVALHRALLPTKDTTPSPRQDSTESTSPIWQRKSAAVPPGLATRATLALDPLQKPSDCIEPKKYKIRQKDACSEPETHVSNSNLAALDLAEQMGGRVLTPTDLEYPQAGVYRHGTLRVTNGAASPDPSMRVASRRGSLVEHDHCELPTPTEYFPALERQPDLSNRSAKSLNRVRRNSSVDSMRTRDGSFTTKKRHRLPALPHSSPAVPTLGVTRPSAPVRAQTVTATSRSEDTRMLPSPELATLARLQQRQYPFDSASHVFTGHANQCQAPAAPHADNSMVSFAARLGAFLDRDDDRDATAGGTPADALALLSGQAKDEQSLILAGPEVSTFIRGQSQPPPIDQSAPRPRAQKTDSGYASGASFHNARRQSAQDYVMGKFSVGSEDKLSGVHEMKERAEKSPRHGTNSLYTFEEVLKSPTMLDKAASQKPRNAAKSKRSLPLLKLHSLKSDKRDSLQTVVASAKDEESPESQLFPCKQPEQTSKLQKKLRKPMPGALKQQRSAEKKQCRESKAMVELSSVPEYWPAPQIRRVRDEVLGNTDFEERFEDDLPAELSAAPPESKWPLFSRSRSKSRIHGRSNSVRQLVVELPGSPEVQRSWTIGRKRSKSDSHSRSESTKRFSVDEALTGSSVSTSMEYRPVTPGDETVPAYTDFNSVARTLGGGSYDISTNMGKRATAPVPGLVQHSLQSPFAISTRLLRTKSQGMTPEMASELARMKSRDVASQDTLYTQDRRRMTVSKQKSRSKMKGGSSPVSERRVEDCFPEWQSKAVATHPAPAPGANSRPYILKAESVPPLPEIPADVALKAHRAGEMIAKKTSKDSARSTPSASARNSADMSQPRPGSGKKSRSSSRARAQQETPMTVEPPTPSGQITVKQTQESDHAPQKPIEEAATHSTASDGLAASESFTSPGRESQHAGWPGWEQQSALWREKRKSMVSQLAKLDSDSLAQADSPPLSRKQSVAELAHSPSIVVSRYITPLSAESAARANAGPPARNTAAQHAEEYIGLIGEEKENRPAQHDVARTGSAVSSASSNATFVTVKSWDPCPVKQNVPRSGGAVSTNAYTTTVTTTTTTSFTSRPKASPAPRVRTASGKFLPYSPTQAAATERSRIEASATPNSPSSAADASSLLWMDGSANSSTTSLGTPCASSHQRKPSVYDRYSGGLEYGWDRVNGLGGSAGTRTSGSEGGQRRSVHVSEQFGIDLSDVPVFLRRMG